MVVLDCLEHLGIPVRGLDERLSLALEDLLGSGSRRVDQCSDLESGSELVLESERVASVSAELDVR